MNVSYRVRSFAYPKNCRWLWRAVVIASIFTFVSRATAQCTSSQQASVAVHGTVRDSAGKPVGDASVRFKEKNGPDAVTTTSPEGAFVFSVVCDRTYFISAEKSGVQSRVTTFPASQTGQEHIVLVLEAPAALQPGQSLSSQSSSEDMTFADKPNFTVAGITDWTAVGGHGSDSILRTSEDLARETTTLKPDNPGRSVSGSGDTAMSSEVESKLRAAVADTPKSFEANHQLGEFCFRAGSYRESISPLEAAYRIDPTNRENEYYLALAYKEVGDFTQAHEHVQKLLAQQNDANLHRLLGELDEKLDDPLAAVHEDEEAVRLDPSEQNYFAWGSELLLHRAVWQAVEVFGNGAKAHPKSARMLAALGAALFAGARYEEAALRLCDAADLNPADAEPYIFIGKIEMAAPAPLACVEEKLGRFVQEQPGNALANYYYAMAIWKRQKASENPLEVQQVESLLTKAVSIDPKYGDAYLQLGILYFSQHNSEKAMGFYAKAIDVNPQLSEAHYRLGVAYDKLGDSAKAKQEFQLHDEIEKQQAAAIERQRREVKQFLVVLQGKPTYPLTH